MNKLSIREHKINEYLTFADLEDCEIFFDKARFKYQVSKILKVGMAFGELSSKIKQRNEAIVCNEDCELAIMVKNDYRDILMEIERIKKNNDLKFLTSTFLKDAPFMSKNSLLSLRCIFEKKKLKGGTSIYEIGENPQECFLMKKGEVEVKI